MPGRLPSGGAQRTTRHPAGRRAPTGRAASGGPDPRRGGHRQRPGRRAGLRPRRRPRAAGPGQGDHGPGGPGAVRRPSTTPWDPTVEASGGSAANTVAGVAALGGRAAFIGRVADDALGQAFTHDIRSIGVAFDPTPTPATDASRSTGHCLVLVTEDAERTMATHLGVASDFGPADLARATTWPPPRSSTWRATCGTSRPPRTAMRQAMELAHASDAAVALTLSDPFCVQATARVPRAAHRRPRAALRQRGGDHPAVRGQRTSRRRWRRWPRPGCWPC